MGMWSLNAYYSAPYRFVGQKLMVRAGVDMVRLYSRNYNWLPSSPSKRGWDAIHQSSTLAANASGRLGDDAGDVAPGSGRDWQRNR